MTRPLAHLDLKDHIPVRDHPGNQPSAAAFALLTACLLVMTGMTACSSDSYAKHHPAAEKGRLDLTGWGFESDGIVDLRGEWAFYWQRLLGPSDFSGADPPRPSGFIRLPGYWNDYEIDGARIGGHGFATYRLIVMLGTQRARLAISVSEISTAYDLYVNGKRLDSVGRVGTRREEASPQYRARVNAFDVESDRLEIILQVSNFAHRRGGVWDVVLLGNEDDVRAADQAALNRNLFLLGSILTMALYHFGLFLFRKEDRSPLHFSILCFLILLRMLTTGQRYLSHIFPEMGWVSLVRLEYLSFFLAVPAFALFMRSLFHRFSNVFLWTLTGLATAFSLAVILTPPRIFSHALNAYELITLAVFGYALTVILRELPHKTVESCVFLFGFLVLGVTVVNDMLHVERIVQTGFYAPAGFFIFILSQALLLSFRFSGAIGTVERQSRELKETFEAYKGEILEHLKAEEALRESEAKARRHQQQMMKADKMVALGTLVSGVAHEINNPNNFIMLNTPILKEAWENTLPVLESYFRKNGDFLIGGMPYTQFRESLPTIVSGIMDGSTRIKQIVDDLKHYVKDESTDLTQSVDLNACIRSAASLLSGMIKKSTDHFRLNCSKDLPHVRGNVRRLEQVFVNLIQNACQALSKPNQAIVVSTASDDAKGLAVISVRDEGVGIPADMIDRIRDPFFTTRQDAGGVGLGLSISCQIVAEHRGTIDFSSEAGAGTTVTVSLPVDRNGNVDKGALQ